MEPTEIGTSAAATGFTVSDEDRLSAVPCIAFIAEGW
jgi:hypothetical protein